MGDADLVASADQDAWVALFTAARQQFAGMIPLMPAMKVEEVKTLTDSMRDVMFAHFRALTFDHDLELENKRSVPHGF